jgi:hypothetical protein
MEMEGIEVVDEEVEEEAGGCLVGDLEGDFEERSEKMASDSRSMDLLTCCTFFVTLPFM